MYINEIGDIGTAIKWQAFLMQKMQKMQKIISIMRIYM